mmetsp:Transcript_40374/g.71044  ORF Transcript_40374/g.71044 Transcript_40374/m.71044 type:complete len:207 (-) Transcript_40374:158-778(-)
MSTSYPSQQSYPQTPEQAMDVSPIDDEIYATHDNTNNNHNTTPPRRASFTGGRTRMRRRGSVVKTMLEDSPKNVDGDGQYMAAASTANTSSYNNYAAVQVQEAMYGDYGANAGMSTQQQINNTNTNNNNTHLPQRRSSVDGSSGRDHERTMLKLQRGSSNFSSSSGGGSNNSQKRDIGREAIRAKAADDLDHVHKIIPKSKDAKLS